MRRGRQLLHRFAAREWHRDRDGAERARTPLRSACMGTRRMQHLGWNGSCGADAVPGGVC